MSAPVRFARSRDGTRIAYTVEGQGPPLLWLNAMTVSHLQLYPTLPGVSEYLAQISRNRTLIRIDFRGTGMAERGGTDHSPDAVTDDLEAIVDELNLTSFDVVAQAMRLVEAVRLATRRPASIRRLVLAIPVGADPTIARGPMVPGLVELARTNWDMWCEIQVQRLSGKPLHQVEYLKTYMQNCIEQRDLLAELDADEPAETWRLSAGLQCPVLVIYRKQALPTQQETANLAQQIPGARLLYLPEEAGSPPFCSRPDLYLQAIEEFLGPVDLENGSDESALTHREEEVLRLLARGYTEAEVAAALTITRATASRHVQNIYGKLEVHRRSEAVAWAIRHGFE
jgi:DNA-binding CsgD family transcriptional regulator/pimeloyl-ACP methyl ester carboxylesterase